MRALRRNKQKIYYCLYAGKVGVVDSSGNETGEVAIAYTEPVEMYCNVSTAAGTNDVEQFGNNLEYDKVIVTDDINCPIDEYSVLIVDSDLEYDGNGNVKYDYIVRRVAKSLNSVSIAISKVKVSL